MTSSELKTVELHDFGPDRDSFRSDVLNGLCNGRKKLPSKYLYDKRGSELFDQICTLDEYYLTRTELRILQDHVAEMASLFGEHCLLIEFGSGSSLKTRILLDHLREPAAYVPVDISKEHLMYAAAELDADYPGMSVLPVCADFTEPFQLPTVPGPVVRRVVYFPGSTIGNFIPEQADDCLAGAAELCGPGGGLLIGVDLKKDRDTLEAAYNDREGITEAFNLNVLARINRELGADFRCEQFRHRAVYNGRYGRVEMHLVSLCDQVVTLGEIKIPFDEGESILTEYSHKYGLADFRRLARAANFEVETVWTDEQRLFSVQYLTVQQTKIV